MQFWLPDLSSPLNTRAIYHRGSFTEDFKLKRQIAALGSELGSCTTLEHRVLCQGGQISYTELLQYSKYKNDKKITGIVVEM